MYCFLFLAVPAPDSNRTNTFPSCNYHHICDRPDHPCSPILLLPPILPPLQRNLSFLLFFLFYCVLSFFHLCRYLTISPLFCAPRSPPTSMDAEGATRSHQRDLPVANVDVAPDAHIKTMDSGSMPEPLPAKEPVEKTIHASGLSSPPATRDAPIQLAAASAPPLRGQQPSPVASPPPKARRPLPSAAPADLAASTGLIPTFPRRTSASHASPRYVIVFFVSFPLISSCLNHCLFYHFLCLSLPNAYPLSTTLLLCREGSTRLLARIVGLSWCHPSCLSV